MNEILKFLQENYLMLAALIPLIISLFGNFKGGIKSLIVEVMLIAEKKVDAEFAKNGAVTGAQKKEFVVDAVFAKLPSAVTFFISKEYIGKKIENIINDLQDLKDDGILNNSFKGE